MTTAEKKAEYARLLKLSTAEVRKAQDDARQQAVKDRDDARKWFSPIDLAAGRGRDIDSHMSEGARAFREGEAAAGRGDQSSARSWYARAYLEYKDASAAAGAQRKEGSSAVETVKTAGKKAADTAAKVAEPILIIAGLALAVSLFSSLNKGRD